VTTLEHDGALVTATTSVNGTPIIRSHAEVGSEVVIAAGHLRYLTQVKQRLVSGLYPYIGELLTPFRVVAIEFLEPSHPVYALRPAAPLEVVPGACFYAPRDSFVYPGGEELLGPAEH
jgi:hypothetical protein